MADSASINTAIGNAAAAGIQSATGDEGSMAAMPINQQIDAAQHLANNSPTAAARPFFGVRIQKIRPPGCGT
jgi:hypothetical protein